VQLEDLELERKYVEQEIYEIEDSQLRELLNKKLQRINEEINKKYAGDQEGSTKFIGIFSYFTGVKVF